MKTPEIVQFFATENVTEDLQHVTVPVRELAIRMSKLPASAERSAGLRKLLEARDCFIRAAKGTSPKQKIGD